MGRTPAQNGTHSPRLRALVAFLLAMVFGLQAVPFVQAQPKTPDCCMATDGKGCSMHLHRAAKAEASSHGMAALQPRCPCTPMVPAACAHDALSMSSPEVLFALASHRTVSVQPRCPCTPMVPAACAHDALSMSSPGVLFALASQRTVSVQPRSLQTAQAAQWSGTRGPPSVMLYA